MPKRSPYFSLILGIILALVSSNVVKFFQAKALVDSGLALESQGFPDLTKALPKQAIENIFSNQPKLREQAIAKYREAIQIAPNYMPAHYNLAYALRTKNLKEEAIAQYREVIRITPDFAPAYQQLGEILHEQGKLPEALAAYIQAIRHDPEFIDPRVQLASLLEKQGRLDEAIAEYKEALRLDPNHPFSGGYDRGTIYVWLGQALVKDRRLAEAIEAYVTAIRITPNCSNFNSFCELIYKDLEPISQKSKPTESISEQLKSIILDSKAQKYLEIGSNYEKQGKQAFAKYYYMQAIRFDPKKAQSYIDLGNTLNTQYTSAKQEVIAAYKQAIHLDPDNQEAYMQLGLFLEIQQGKLDQAIANYREAIRLAPNNAVAHERIGGIFYQQGKYQKATPYLKAALNEYKPGSYQNTFSEKIKEIQEKLQEIEKQ